MIDPKKLAWARRLKPARVDYGLDRRLFEDFPMELSDFPDCCGATVVSSFPVTPLTPIEKAAFLLECFEELKNVAFLVATTNNRNQKVGVALMKWAGFERVSSGTNPGHNSRLSMWVLTKSRKRKR